MSEEWDVRVDRQSVLGNPYYMQDESMRDQVCEQYRVWLRAQVKEQTKAYEELLRLVALYRKHGKLRLFCWCAPKRCHAETIRKAIEFFAR